MATEIQKKQEELLKNKRDLQAIMDHSPTIIYVKDTDGRYLFINQQYENLFHIKQKDIINKTDYALFSKDFADKFRVNDETVLKTGKALEIEEAAPLEDDTHIYISIKFPLIDEQNNIYAVCGISTDVTESRIHEEQLRRSQKMDALGKLTGGIAHDYNNMLGVIMGYSELLQSMLKDQPKLAEYANKIYVATERGTKLTKNLLSFSRKQATQPTQQDINILLEKQKNLLEKTLTVRTKLLFKLGKDVWPIFIDNSEFDNTLLNLSINAMHAMHAMQENRLNTKVTICTSNQSLNETDATMLNLKTGDYIKLSIIDTGCGMDETTKEKIFDPFFTTKGNRGTGLGLSQVFSFMQRAGGNIKVYSELDHGSEFVLYFPRYKDTTKLEEKSAPLETKKTFNGTETLLIVDDEQSMIDLAREILEAQGYHILTANDGIQALKELEKFSLKKEKIELIVSDVLMPNMNGYQLAAQVHKLYPHIKMQMVSGFSDDRHELMEDKTLHENILHKPYTSNVLLSRIRNLLDKNTPVDILHGRTILIMDDDEDIQTLYKINLKKLGCHVITAANGDEAIDHYKKSLKTNNPIDIVIVDLNIPNSMGGKEVAIEIRKLSPNVKIIAAGGNAEVSEMQSPQEHGFDAALEKDFNREIMKHKLEQALHHTNPQK